MKTKILFETFLLSLSLFCISSCSDDTKNDEMRIPENIDKAFSNKYSSAQPRTWSRYGTYYIATFTDAGNFNETAWFDSNGIWQMSKTDLPKTQTLPSAVEYAFSNSEYAGQKITTITRIERLMMEGTLYRISVAKGEIKQDIYIQENGTLLQSLYGNQNQFWLIEVPQEINQYMTDNYKGIPILGILLNDNGKIELYVLHDSYLKRIILDWDAYWLSTSRPLDDTEQLPNWVMNYISGHYAGYTIVERRYEESSHGNYYCIRLKTSDDDTILSLRDDLKE